MTTTVKAMIAKAWGGPDSLVYDDLALPELGPKSVCIRVKAAGLWGPNLPKARSTP